MSDRVVCVRCTAPYLPSLTKHRCPVCDSPAPGTLPHGRAWQHPDDRMLAIVVLATMANALLLAVLTLVVLR